MTLFFAVVSVISYPLMLGLFIGWRVAKAILKTRDGRAS